MRRVLPSLPWFRNRPAALDRARDAARSGPSIAIMGNCQARVVAQALRVLAPHSPVTLLPLGRLGKEHRSLGAFAESLRGYDHVFVQHFTAGFFPEGGATELAALNPAVRLFPGIVFPAFHPDAVYVGDVGSQAESRLVPSPLHTYHSAIALFGHLRGLDAPRILRLFRAEVFERLGYLRLWQPSADELVAYSAATGFDLTQDLARWARRGAFMHVFNHPKLFVLGDVAARLLRESGLEPADLPLDAYLADDLLGDVVWPVYGPIAAFYGVPGSYTFKRRQRRDEAPSLLGLDAFVTESLALYRTMRPERLRCRRVEEWAERADIREMFDVA